MPTQKKCARGKKKLKNKNRIRYELEISRLIYLDKLAGQKILSIISHLQIRSIRSGRISSLI